MRQILSSGSALEMEPLLTTQHPRFTLHAGAYCLRASTVKEYMQANLDVSRESRVTLYEKAAVRAKPLFWIASTTAFYTPPRTTVSCGACTHP